MPDPVLHLIAGPNGAGKSMLFDLVIGPATGLELVNADVIAAERREDLLASGSSFVTETVFSHESKLDLVKAAVDARYIVTLHIVMVPEELAVARVPNRVENGGHDVPEEKIRSRYKRLWPLVAQAITLVDEAKVYDNSVAKTPFRVVASFDRGVAVARPKWPKWTPKALRSVG